MKYAVSGSSYSHSVEYKYDATNKLLELVETVNGIVLTTSYTYDVDNRVTSVTTTTEIPGDDPEQDVETTVTEEYTYDDYGRLTTKVTKQLDTAPEPDVYVTVLTESYTYKENNGYPTTQVASKVGRNAGNAIIYSYSYAYDANGNITRVWDTINLLEITYAYDSANQLVRENNQAAGKSWEWEYDNAGNILTRTEYAYTTGTLGAVLDTVTYTYDDADWGDLLTGYDGRSFDYDTVGNLTDDDIWTYVWEHGRQLAGMSGEDVYGENTDTSVSYTYDADGMRTGKTVTQGHSYSTQLIPATCMAEGYTLYTCGCGDSYKDDIVGIQEHNYGFNGDESNCLWCGEPRGEIILPPITPVDPPISQIGLFPEISLGHVSTETATYSYIYTGGQLTQMGIVSETTTNGATTTASHTLTFIYDATGNPQTVTYDGTTYYYAVNLQGDVVAILDSTGTAVVSYTYDAWGNHLETSGTMATTLGNLNPLRYRGYVYDTETQLYYLQSRYYNPKIGRFLNADALVSTGQGLLGNNMFAYCLNNPVNGADPAGYRVESKPILFEFAWPYIYNQKDPGVGELRFGVATVAHGGCGAVATYNALVSMGHGVPFGQVLEWYNDRTLQMFFFGAAGMLPEMVADYFWDHGYVVFSTDDPEMIDYFSTTADACIIWYTFTTDSFPFVGGHFVEYSRTANGYEGRNAKGGIASFESPSVFGSEGKRFYMRGIFIYRLENLL